MKVNRQTSIKAFFYLAGILYFLSTAVHAEKVDCSTELIGQEDQFTKYNFTITDDSGAAVYGRHVVVPLVIEGVSREILTAQSNADGKTTIILPIEVLPVAQSKTMSARSTNSDDSETVDSIESIGCCAQTLYCGDKSCGSSCFPVFDLLGIVFCRFNNKLENMDAVYSEDKICVSHDWGCQCEDSTLIELSELIADPGNKQITLQWNTASEIDNAGFNIYRATSEGGDYIRINSELIPSEGNPVEGASYGFIDSGLKNRKTYYYELEDVDMNGTATMHGPVSATPKLFNLFGK